MGSSLISHLSLTRRPSSLEGSLAILFISYVYIWMVLISEHSLCNCNNVPLIDAEIDEDGNIPELELPGTRFTIMRKRAGQAEALAECEKRHPKDRLAVFPTYEVAFTVSLLLENISAPYTPEYEVNDNITEFGPDRRYWIGLSDMYEEGEWFWLKSDGLALEYDFWLAPQPDHLEPDGTTREHCVTLWNPNYYKDPPEFHTFNDENCLNKNYFICEKHMDAKGKRGRSFIGTVVIDSENGTEDDLPFGVTILEHSFSRNGARNRDLDAYSESLENEETSKTQTKSEGEHVDYRLETNKHNTK